MIWLEPWYSVADKPAEAAGMSRELQAELALGHPLFGVPVETLGRRCDCDDVAYRLLDGSGRIAVVHLTYNHNAPAPLSDPWTTFYETLERWIGECMLPDHQEYAGLGPAASDR
jgi:hypothetical protein